MITVQDVFDYAIDTDSKLLAHAVYWALSKKLIRLGDDAASLNLDELDQQEVKRLTDANLLGIGRIQLFVIETDQAGWFAFYFAENVLDASRLHEKVFRTPARKITRANRLMNRFMTLADTQESIWLYEYRKRTVAFPAYIGHAYARDEVLYRMGASA